MQQKQNSTHNLGYWLIFVLLCIWQLPQVLVGLVMMPFIGKMTLVADGHYNLCWYGTGMSGGISLGSFAFISKAIYNSRFYLETIAHEFNGHTTDSKIFGPLYLIIIGIPSILNAMFGFTRNYYDFYPEKWANNHAGLTAENGYLEFKDEESRQNIEQYLVSEE